MTFYCEDSGLFDMVFLGSSTGGPFLAPGKVGSDMPMDVKHADAFSEIRVQHVSLN